ncbi:hypothetical protein LA080_012635 [Diaporthe eres]|nr:hypothetical protein LA080_012635 [Diaporthe eres]
MISYRHRQRVGVDRNNNLVMPTSCWNYQAMGASGPLGLLQCACVSEARDSRLIVLRRCNLMLRHGRYWCWPPDLSLRLHRKNLDARDVTLAVLDRPRVKPCVPFLLVVLLLGRGLEGLGTDGARSLVDGGRVRGVSDPATRLKCALWLVHCEVTVMDREAASWLDTCGLGFPRLAEGVSIFLSIGQALGGQSGLSMHS